MPHPSPTTTRPPADAWPLCTMPGCRHYRITPPGNLGELLARWIAKDGGAVCSCHSRADVMANAPDFRRRQFPCDRVSW